MKLGVRCEALQTSSLPWADQVAVFVKVLIRRDATDIPQCFTVLNIVCWIADLAMLSGLQTTLLLVLSFNLLVSECQVPTPADFDAHPPKLKCNSLLLLKGNSGFVLEGLLKGEYVEFYRVPADAPSSTGTGK